MSAKDRLMVRFDLGVADKHRWSRLLQELNVLDVHSSAGGSVRNPGRGSPRSTLSRLGPPLRIHIEFAGNA